jgi:hypothetical protein
LISKKTKRVVHFYFPDSQEVIEEKLKVLCMRLPFRDSSNDYERVCFAVLKVGKNSVEKIDEAIKLGEWDFRDLLVKAGFANSVNSHKIWGNKILPGLYHLF